MTFDLHSGDTILLQVSTRLAGLLGSVEAVKPFIASGPFGSDAYQNALKAEFKKGTFFTATTFAFHDFCAQGRTGIATLMVDPKERNNAVLAPVTLGHLRGIELWGGMVPTSAVISEGVLNALENKNYCTAKAVVMATGKVDFSHKQTHPGYVYGAGNIMLDQAIKSGDDDFVKFMLTTFKDVLSFNPKNPLPGYRPLASVLDQALVNLVNGEKNLKAYQYATWLIDNGARLNTQHNRTRDIDTVGSDHMVYQYRDGSVDFDKKALVEYVTKFEKQTRGLNGIIARASRQTSESAVFRPALVM